MAFGAGLGIGSAYSDCSRIFEGSAAKSAPPSISDAPAPQVGFQWHVLMHLRLSVILDGYLLLCLSNIPLPLIQVKPLR